jgi:hypothetical protein
MRNSLRSAILAAALIGAPLLHPSAAAAITVDGVLDPEFGAPSAIVGYDPGAPDSNFGSPTNLAKDVGYSIYVSADAGFWYGYFLANPAGGGSAVASFANLYFDMDPANNNGSDIGFELSPGNQDVFIPGIAGSNTTTSDILVAVLGNAIEVGIPLSYFTGPFDSLPYYPGHDFATDSLVLRLSQTFGYSVAGGDTYGPDRLGAVTLAAAVPEPLTVSIFAAGLIGAAAFRRRRKMAVA